MNSKTFIEEYIDRYDNGDMTIELRENDDRNVIVTKFLSNFPLEGSGSRALALMCRTADKHMVVPHLPADIVIPENASEEHKAMYLDRNALVEWYQRNGFVKQGNAYTREPVVAVEEGEEEPSQMDQFIWSITDPLEFENVTTDAELVEVSGSPAIAFVAKPASEDGEIYHLRAYVDQTSLEFLEGQTAIVREAEGNAVTVDKDQLPEDIASKLDRLLNTIRNTTVTRKAA